MEIKTDKKEMTWKSKLPRSILTLMKVSGFLFYFFKFIQKSQISDWNKNNNCVRVFRTFNDKMMKHLMITAHNCFYHFIILSSSRSILHKL